jgi:hypothetical protein
VTSAQTNVFINVSSYLEQIEILTASRIFFNQNPKPANAGIQGQDIFVFSSGLGFIDDGKLSKSALTGFTEQTINQLSVISVSVEDCFVGSYGVTEGGQITLVVHSQQSDRVTALDCFAAGAWLYTRGSLDGFRSDFWWSLINELMD